MAIPAYLWLKDDGGADIKGAVDVQDREGSIEVLGFSHGLHLPTDNMTGKTLPNHSHYRILMHGLLASGTFKVTAGLDALGTIQVY